MALRRLKPTAALHSLDQSASETRRVKIRVICVELETQSESGVCCGPDEWLDWRREEKVRLQPSAERSGSSLAIVALVDSAQAGL
ncbi:hypothetical protein IWQ49_000067 [Labrenzia sp. EL_126]|nr:hypothetical protein [Labrenzia sp. EL_126]